MNPADLVTPQVLEICRHSSTIVIAGYTKTGKITIAKKISQELNIPLFISDNYINEQDRLKSLYDLRDAILPYYNRKIPFVVEGVLAFRLLRKGIQMKDFYPDLIIKTICNDETIKHFYIKDKEIHKLKHALAYNKGLNTIWEEYLRLLHTNPFIRKPKYIELETTLPQYK